jgi:phage/plasmid-associated DNA primase
MTFDRKNIAPIEALPTARLTLVTNNKPRFRDRSNGIWRRLLLLVFNVGILKKDRILGADKPQWWVASGELPGMLVWALEGLRRLMEQKKFTEPKESTVEIAEYRLDSHPELRFFDEHCRHAPGKHVAQSALYLYYRHWCDGNGYPYPLAANMLGKELVKYFPHLREHPDQRKKYSGQRDDGTKYRYYGYPDLEHSFEGFEKSVPDALSTGTQLGQA